MGGQGNTACSLGVCQSPYIACPFLIDEYVGQFIVDVVRDAESRTDALGHDGGIVAEFVELGRIGVQV